jgi:hypothetical protein
LAVSKVPTFKLQRLKRVATTIKKVATRYNEKECGERFWVFASGLAQTPKSPHFRQRKLHLLGNLMN